MTNKPTVDAVVAPQKVLSVLSQAEVENLVNGVTPSLEQLFRRCALAVLSSGSESDDARALFSDYGQFDVSLVRESGGLRLELRNAPASAFVGDRIIRGTAEHLFSVLRDLLYITQELDSHSQTDLASSAGITDVVFKILRNAGVLTAEQEHGLVVCWGGHAISRTEYDYTKEVGYALGLRDLDVCTGCGPGAMKGPMKGAAIAHAKQRVRGGRYLGITEPAIIAAEAPNPIVNQLVIMPDIEKRLEAFVRLAHGLIVFPGGVGTAEELLYLLGILADPRNVEIELPIVLTGPPGAAGYFEALDRFITTTLGEQAAARYEIIIDDPAAVGVYLEQRIVEVLAARGSRDEALYFNWGLSIEDRYQQPFEVNHESMSKLRISRSLPEAELAANLRRAFSGIVAGNIKEDGIAAVELHGPFQIQGEPQIMAELDSLLRSFVAQGRMRLSDEDYQPCFEIVASSG